MCDRQTLEDHTAIFAFAELSVSNCLALYRSLIPLSVARAAYLTFGETGALDLHPYWYYGHFVRMGINPYTAFEQGRLLPRPAHYLVGSEVAPAAVVQS